MKIKNLKAGQVICLTVALIVAAPTLFSEMGEMKTKKKDKNAQINNFIQNCRCAPLCIEYKEESMMQQQTFF